MTTTVEDKWRVNGIDFYVKSTLPAAGTRTAAKVLLLHGFAEHIDRYSELFDVLASNGIEVFAFDQRGAGKTSREKKDWGMTDEKMVYLDLEDIINRKIGPDVVEARTPIPWFMVGFSMGGAICLNYAIKGQHRQWFAGYIAVTPLILLHPRTRPNPITYYVLLGISKLFPRLQHFTGLDFDFLSRDPISVQKIKDDPMCHATCTLKQMSDMLDRGQKLLDEKYCSKIVNRPVLVLHGDADKVNFYGASKEFIDKIPINDKKLVTIVGGYHELQNEIESDRKKFHAELTNWILDKSSAKFEAKL
ncbi:Alpha/Beta hydrolase protein [Lipomyces tetrasporus]|uniref:Alpha/Beta hydrolase protein n=1 Tax=Lipomyces tetrasporus TaxID=54092 RepID=A0AAD7QY23_9ASCO|nr:Alpha/Beta hydrolase protein [Lipomyces tetrasporus]KAJ8103528.1 Alpha/Beta hydrolase protein [Lipomyces tetrasporus]